MSVHTADVAAVLDDPWVDTKGAAQHALKHPVTIRKAAARGELRSTSAGSGRGRRYRLSWVDEWLHQPARRTDRRVS
ncbi:MAG TPA: hypothetical protein VHK64_06225 [Nocardioidaceae bacterium]|nr:hypothetical protein [Nocardioidaceae bacterium]